MTYIFSALFVLVYWILTSLAGSLLGALITFDTSGIDFALTGLFIVILTATQQEFRHLYRWRDEMRNRVANFLLRE